MSKARSSALDYISRLHCAANKSPEEGNNKINSFRVDTNRSSELTCECTRDSFRTARRMDHLWGRRKHWAGRSAILSILLVINKAGYLVASLWTTGRRQSLNRKTKHSQPTPPLYRSRSHLTALLMDTWVKAGCFFWNLTSISSLEVNSAVSRRRERRRAKNVTHFGSQGACQHMNRGVPYCCSIYRGRPEALGGQAHFLAPLGLATL